MRSTTGVDHGGVRSTTGVDHGGGEEHHGRRSWGGEEHHGRRSWEVRGCIPPYDRSGGMACTIIPPYKGDEQMKLILHNTQINTPEEVVSYIYMMK